MVNVMGGLGDHQEGAPPELGVPGSPLLFGLIGSLYYQRRVRFSVGFQKVLKANLKLVSQPARGSDSLRAPYTLARCTPNHFFRSHQVCSSLKPLSRRIDSIMSSVYL